MLKRYFWKFGNFGFKTVIREKDAKLRKLQIFKHSFTVKNLYVSELDLNTKKNFGDFEVFDLKGKNY